MKAHVLMARCAGALAIVIATGVHAWSPTGVALGRAYAGAGGPITVAAIPDGSGGAIVVWPNYADLVGASILAQRVTSSGAIAPGWLGDGCVLGAPRAAAGAPRVVADGSSGAFVAWSEWDSLQAFWDVGLQRVTANGRIAPGWPPSGLTLGIHSEFAGAAVAPDGAGGILIAWLDRRANDHLEMRAARYTAAGLLAPGWPATGLVLSTTAHSGAPSLAVSGDGRAYVVWTDGRGSDPDIYVQRLTMYGAIAPGWPGGGVAVCKKEGQQLWPSCFADGAGGVVVSWYDFRTISYEPYLQRITGLGGVASGWPADGRGVCDAPGCSGGNQRAIADGTGGAFVAWASGPGVEIDVFVQRIRGDGQIAPGWPSLGHAVNQVAREQVAPDLAVDDAGGVFVAWEDDSGVFETFIQRLTATGDNATGWPTDGLDVSTSTGLQWTPKLVSDWQGGAIVLWLDGRGNSWSAVDIYAQRIRPDGQVPTDIGTTRDAFAGGLAVWPNPFHLETRIQLPSTLQGPIDMRVYDVAGRLVRTLSSRRSIPGHGLVWDGRAENGQGLPGATYFVRAWAPGFDHTQKVVLLPDH